MVSYANSLRESNGYIFGMGEFDTRDELLDAFSKAVKESGQDKYFIEALVKLVKAGLAEYKTMERVVEEINKHDYEDTYPESIEVCHREIAKDNRFYSVSPEFTLGFTYIIFREYSLREGIYRDELIMPMIDELVPCNNVDYGKYSEIHWMDIMDFYYIEEMHNGFAEITLKETGNNTKVPEIYILEKILELGGN